jgi:ribosomal protein S18 acetylase RimI-like enzyme
MDKGAHEILLTVALENQSAGRLYKRQGFLQEQNIRHISGPGMTD